MSFILKEELTKKYIPVLAGLGQGLVFFTAFSAWGDSASRNAWLAAAVYFFSASGISLQLTWSGRDSKRSFALAAALGFVIAAVALWAWSGMPELARPGSGVKLYDGDDLRTYTFIFAAVSISYIAIAYEQVYQQGGMLSFPYQELFRHSWNNFFIILVGAVFAGLVWGLIALCAGLFSAVGIDFFKNIFYTPHFAFIVTPAVFGLGLSIGKDNTQIINTLRNVALSVIKALLPALAVIAIAFVVALPFTGLKPLWATKHAAALALGMIVIAIVFMNAVFQDGRPDLPYRRGLMRLVDVLMVLLPVYGLLALYALMLRIDQYGFTPSRVFALSGAILALLYATGYAASVFLKSLVWMGAIRRVNVVMSVAVVCAAILLHTPIIDPLSISASNQFSRLVNGKADPKSFDYVQMRFNFGRAGYEKLKDLENSVGGADAAVIRKMVASTLRLRNRWDKLEGKRVDLKLKDIVVIPRKLVLPSGLFDYLKTNVSEYESESCVKNKDCMLIAANLDSDPADEYLFIASHNYYNVRLIDSISSGKWGERGSYSIVTDKGESINADALQKEIIKGGFKPVVRKYRDVRAGSFTLLYKDEKAQID